MIEVRPARSDEVPALAVMLGRAFRDDVMLTWTFPNVGDDTVARFFASLDRGAAERGWLWTAGDGGGVAMWAPPGSEGGYADLLDDTTAVVRMLVDDGGERYERFWDWIEALRPAEPHWYLDHVAVDAARRGEGLGLALVEHGIGRAGAEGAPAFLVTSRPTNLSFYERRGFAIAAEDDAPDGGPHLWFMRWDADRERG